MEKTVSPWPWRTPPWEARGFLRPRRPLAFPPVNSAELGEGPAWLLEHVALFGDERGEPHALPW